MERERLEFVQMNDPFNERLAEAEKEAKRFLRRAADFRRSLNAEAQEYWFSSSKERAAVKRSSMDLSRSLSDLRRRA